MAILAEKRHKNTFYLLTVLLLLYRPGERVVESFTGKAMDWNMYLWRLSGL